MKLVRSPAMMARLAAHWKRHPVVLVPTMGALHDGHLALIDRARRAAGRKGFVVVSIFVNPTQFGPKEDFSKYPRPLRRDLELCRRHKTDLVFNPSAEEMYAGDKSVIVDETLLSKELCGRSREGHFRGVCTVVAKLFNLVRPDAVVFGRKDFQQLAIIQRMVRDLNFPVEIIPLDTVREPDGLAMSSRNVYLSAEERTQAPALRRALLMAQARARAGERDATTLRLLVEREIAEHAPQGRPDYINIVDAENMQSLAKIETRPALLALAVFFGKTRLIDNVLIEGQH